MSSFTTQRFHARSEHFEKAEAGEIAVIGSSGDGAFSVATVNASDQHRRLGVYQIAEPEPSLLAAGSATTPA